MELNLTNLSVKQARIITDKTQRQIAAEMGVSRDVYRRIEKNPETATIEQAKRFCRATGFDLDRIFFAH